MILKCVVCNTPDLLEMSPIDSASLNKSYSFLRHYMIYPGHTVQLPKMRIPLGCVPNNRLCY